MTAVSWSTCSAMSTCSEPDPIHRYSVSWIVAPPATSRNAATDSAHDPATAGTATQCARGPIQRPKRPVTRKAANGRSGIRTIEDIRENPSPFHQADVLDVDRRAVAV